MSAVQTSSGEVVIEEGIGILRGHPYATSNKIWRVGVVEIGLFRNLGGERVLGFMASEIFMRNSWLLY